MKSPSSIKELEETKTKDTHPDTNNVSDKTKSSITSKSIDMKLQDTVWLNNYPGSTPTKTSVPVEPTNKWQNYTDTQQSAKTYPYSLRRYSKK